jgi:hypothetical protein
MKTQSTYATYYYYNIILCGLMAHVSAQLGYHQVPL